MRHLVAQHCAQLNQMCILWSSVICLQRFYFCQHIWQLYDRLQAQNNADKNFAVWWHKNDITWYFENTKITFWTIFLTCFVSLERQEPSLCTKIIVSTFCCKIFMKNEAESQAVFAVSYVRNVRGRAMLPGSTNCY